MHAPARLFLSVLLTAALLAPTPAGLRADDAAPFPPGVSSHEIEGLRCSVVMPAAFDAERERSLVVILHGLGGTETGMANALAFLAEQDYVVVPPKSRGQGWDPKDTASVRRIVADLVQRLRVGKGRVHGVGFSNGGWNLADVVFESEVEFASACWVAAGYKGGTVPKHARKGLGALALAGADDANRSAAEQTPKALADKVRSAEVRIQPGLGHAWPAELIPYYAWWLGVQEGRFVPGETLAFAWHKGQAAGLEALAASGTPAGGFAYWYSAADTHSAEAKALQNDVLQDPLVRHFGGQLVAWKVAREDHAEEFQALKLKRTPAVVVYDAAGKVKKTLEGDVGAKALSAALRSVAPNKKPPD